MAEGRDRWFVVIYGPATKELASPPADAHLVWKKVIYDGDEANARLVFEECRENLRASGYTAPTAFLCRVEQAAFRL